VDLGRVIHRAAEESRPLMEAKQHEFHVALPTQGKIISSPREDA
jgi:hypothetical protein